MTNESINDDECNDCIKTHEKTRFNLTKYEKILSWGLIAIANFYLIICLCLVIGTILEIDFARALLTVAVILCLITWYFTLRYQYHKSQQKDCYFYDIELFMQRVFSTMFLPCLLGNFFIYIIF